MNLSNCESLPLATINEPPPHFSLLARSLSRSAIEREIKCARAAVIAGRFLITIKLHQHCHIGGFNESKAKIKVRYTATCDELCNVQATS